MFRTSLIIGIAVAFFGFLISSNTALRSTERGNIHVDGGRANHLWHQEQDNLLPAMIKPAPSPAAPASTRRGAGSAEPIKNAVDLVPTGPQ